MSHCGPSSFFGEMILNYGSIKSCVTPKHNARGTVNDDEATRIWKGVDEKLQTMKTKRSSVVKDDKHKAVCADV